MPLDRKTYVDDGADPEAIPPNLLSGKTHLLAEADRLIGPVRCAFFWTTFINRHKSSVCGLDGKALVTERRLPCWNLKVYEPRDGKWYGTGLWLIEPRTLRPAPFDRRVIEWLSWASRASPRYRDAADHSEAAINRELAEEKAAQRQSALDQEAVMDDVGARNIQKAVLANAGMLNPHVDRIPILTEKQANKMAADLGVERRKATGLVTSDGATPL